MKILDRFSFLSSKQAQPTLSGRLAIVHWDRDNLFYLVSSGANRSLKEGEHGVVSLIPAEAAGDATGGGSVGGGIDESKRHLPLVALANHFQEHRINANRLVVLLSRPELDLLTLSLPPASVDELPTLVASEVEQQQGESNEPPSVDFYVIQDTGIEVPPQDTSDAVAGKQVFAFAINQRYFDSLQSQCNESGFKLAAIGSRHLSPLSLLRQSGVPSKSVTISIHLLTGEAEVAICSGSEPLMLRSIRYSAEDPERVAEQIDTEANRCLTLLPQSLGELSANWIVYETGDFARQVAKAVEAQEPGKVRLIDPLSGWSGTTEPYLSNDLRSALGSVPTTSAAAVGAALDLLDKQSLPVNLLAPKRAPAPPNPWVRWGALGALGTAAAFAGGYFLLSDVWELQDEVGSLQSSLKDTAKVTSKFQEKSDQVALVESWLSDQVDWVSELSDLAARLPDGQDATVRRLTATVNAKGNGTLDLSMQVKSQEIISELENRIRGAKYTIVSKQITQNAESQEYPWQFESHIEFPIQGPGLKRFAPMKSEAPQSSPSDQEPEDDEAKKSEAKKSGSENSGAEKLLPDEESDKKKGAAS
ncbi:MAG: hypothetical protein ACKN9S_18100 [Pirellula sp.]